MKSKAYLRPLGEIIHILNGEAITHPLSPFIGKNSRVVLENEEEIGRLGDPFGLADRPYQPIILKNPKQKDLVGKIVFAKLISNKKQYKKRKKYRNKNNNKEKQV